MNGNNPPEMKRAGAGNVYISATHHADLAWKWKYEEYAAQRAAQFDQVAAWFERRADFHFHVEQAELFRVYFEACPGKLPTYRKACAEGRLTLTGGNSIPDLNFCHGESFVRNLRRGQAYYREVFGKQAEIANLDDAFGMPFQIPQILALAEYGHLLPGRLANAPKDLPDSDPFLWRGANGTAVVVVNSMFWLDAGSKKQSLPLSHSPADCVYKSFADIRRSGRSGDIMVVYNTETGLFCEDFFPAIEAINQEPGRYRVRFGSLTDYCAAVPVQKLPAFSGEFNPTFTGCYTTRSAVKRNIRKAENLLFAAEMLAAGRGVDVDLDHAWRQLELASFHDAACGCHHDPVNVQVMAKLKEAQSEARKALRQAAAGLCVFNPARAGGLRLVETKGAAPKGVAVQRSGKSLFFTAELPGCGTAPLTPGKAPEVAEQAGAKFSTKHFDVDFSGVHPKITDKMRRRNVFPADGFGEIFFRLDRGTMWVESLAHHWYGREAQREAVDSITAGPVFYEVVTEGEVLPNPGISVDGSKYSYWEAFRSLKFRKTYRFYRELDYFTLNLGLDWRGDATKIQIQFPTTLNVPETVAVFDTPFGSVERAPYYEVPKKFESTFKALSAGSYSTAKGDWPALHWVDYRDQTGGLAMANAGTPGHQLVAGALVVSLIRSGTGSNDGNMKPQPGAFDNGHHEFEFAFRPHDVADMDNAPALGEVLNRRPILLRKGGQGGETTSFLSGLPGNIMVSSMRRTADVVVVRLYETSGKETALEGFACLGRPVVGESNLLERQWANVNGPLRFTPFEIKTLLYKA